MAIFLDVSPKGQVEPDFSERLFVAVLSFTDLLKSLLNPFLFPGSALLGVMNDLHLSPPGTPGNLAFGDIVSCGVGRLGVGGAVFAVPSRGGGQASRLRRVVFSSVIIVGLFFLLSLIPSFVKRCAQMCCLWIVEFFKKFP